eukprot:403360378
MHSKRDSSSFPNIKPQQQNLLVIQKNAPKPSTSHRTSHSMYNVIQKINDVSSPNLRESLRIEESLNTINETFSQEYGHVFKRGKLEQEYKEHKQRVRQARNYGKTIQSLEQSPTDKINLNSSQELKKLKDKELEEEQFQKQIMYTHSSLQTDSDDAIMRYNRYLNKLLLSNKDEYFNHKLKNYVQKQKSKQVGSAKSVSFFSRMNQDVKNRQIQQQNEQQNNAGSVYGGGQSNNGTTSNYMTSKRGDLMSRSGLGSSSKQQRRRIINQNISFDLNLIKDKSNISYSTDQL